MAIKFDEKSEINNLFGKADDVAVDFTTLDGKTHRWVFTGGGRFLLTEFPIRIRAGAICRRHAEGGRRR